MSNFKNPYKKSAVIWLVITLVFGFGIFLPFHLNFKSDTNAIGLAVLAGFFAMFAFIGAVVVFRLARAQDKLFADSFLAHWTYTDEQWKMYTDREHATNKKSKMRLFFVIATCFAMAGIVFPIFDFKNGIIVTYICMGMIVFFAFIAWLSIHLPHQRNLKNRGEVFIGQQGASVNGQLHPWGILGSHLEDIRYEPGPPPEIIFSYSTPNRGGRITHDVRIPIPTGQENEAEKIVSILGSQK